LVHLSLSIRICLKKHLENTPERNTLSKEHPQRNTLSRNTPKELQNGMFNSNPLLCHGKFHDYTIYIPGRKELVSVFGLFPKDNGTLVAFPHKPKGSPAELFSYGQNILEIIAVKTHPKGAVLVERDALISAMRNRSALDRGHDLTFYDRFGNHTIASSQVASLWRAFVCQ